MGVVGAFASAFHLQEEGVRLLFSVLAGYPLAALWRTFIYNQSKQVKHAFIVGTGVALYLFNYGFTIYHSLLSITFAWAITNFLRGHQNAIIAAHVCFLGHLLMGYWFAESDTYDITWTTPFCIMTIRFIGLAMDVYDGQKDEKELKTDQKETAIKDPPDWLETAAFGLFFVGTLVGPQFTLRRFRDFIDGKFNDDKTGEVRQSALMPSLGRFVAGVTYMVIHQWGAVWIPSAYFNSPEFFAQPFLWKVIWSTIWFRLTMYRYCAAWLIAEGAAILVGIAYNGKDKNGEDRWDGVRDLHITGWELGTDFTSVIQSFNCGTNTFAKNHLFRRLIWLGNKNLSHVATLVYLAVWHGYHLGYFVLFFYEFACIMCQEQFYSLLRRLPAVQKALASPFARPFVFVFGRIFINVSMAFAFLSFGLVKTRIWWEPVKSVYFAGHIWFFALWPITYQALRRVLPRPPSSGTSPSKSSADGVSKKSD